MLELRSICYDVDVDSEKKEILKSYTIQATIMNMLINMSNQEDSFISVPTELKEEYDTTTNVGEYNQKTLNIMIDSGVITEENAKRLIEKGKIKGVTIE